MTTADQLIRDIEAAFASVELGAGLTLHEAQAFEGTDYCTAEERASVRALDPLAPLAGHTGFRAGGLRRPVEL